MFDNSGDSLKIFLHQIKDIPYSHWKKKYPWVSA